MIKGMKFMMVFLTMMVFVLPVYAQEKVQQEVTLVSGEIVSVDLVKSNIAIKILKDTAAKTYENQNILVSSEAKIIKGDAVLKLSDIKAGDKVTINYTTDAQGQWKAESVSVENIAAVPVK